MERESRRLCIASIYSLLAGVHMCVFQYIASGEVKQFVSLMRCHPIRLYSGL